MSFSWMLTAGVSVSISPRMMLDVGWRYMDHGTIETSSSTGRVVCRVVGSDDCKALAKRRRDAGLPPLPLSLDLDKTHGELRSHGLNVSLRYAF